MTTLAASHDELDTLLTLWGYQKTWVRFGIVDVIKAGHDGSRLTGDTVWTIAQWISALKEHDHRLAHRPCPTDTGSLRRNAAPRLWSSDAP